MTTSQNEITEGNRPATTILVTGGLGYLGSQTVRDLAVSEQLGDTTIRILDNMQGEHHQALMGLPDRGRYQFVAGDILDPATVRMALRGVDAVVHLAAIVRTPMSFERPAWVEQVNHWGTSQLLEACLEVGVPRFIFASTTAVYGPGGPFIESDPCRPQGAYAQSKMRAEKAVLAAFERGLQSTILRLGIIYGLAPVTRFDAVANRFAFLAGTGRPLVVYGDGEQRRSLIHVRDASRAICFSLTQTDSTAGAAFNAIDRNVSVMELVETIQQIKPDVPVHFTEQDIRTHLSFAADNSALLELGWKPAVAVKAGLAELLKQFTGLEAMIIQPIDFE